MNNEFYVIIRDDRDFGLDMIPELFISIEAAESSLENHPQPFKFKYHIAKLIKSVQYKYQKMEIEEIE